MSTEPSLDEQIEQVQEELRGVLDEYGALRPGCALLARNYKAILASLNRLRALPRERECICDDHQGTHMRCPQHGTDYIDHDAVAREQAVDKGPRLILLKQLELAAQFLDRKDCHVMGESVRTAIAALSPQAYTPAALSTTSADTSRERGEVIPCSRGDLTADDLEELVDKLCKPQGYEPSSDDLYRTQVALLYLSIRMRSAHAAAPVEMERDARRYRWLRNEGSHMGILEWRAIGADYQNLEQLDAAIDAAIAAAGGA